MGQATDAVRITGVVGGNGTLTHSASLTVADEEHRSAPEPTVLEVTCEDGRVIEVCVGRSTVIGPVTTRRARWGELVKDPLSGGQLFAAVAPGNHIEVELCGVVVRAGDRVTVEGPAEYEREGGGYREGAERVISRVHARRIGVGDEGASWMVTERCATSAVGRPRSEKKGVRALIGSEADNGLSLLPCRILAFFAVGAWVVVALMSGGTDFDGAGVTYAYINTMAFGLLAAGLGIWVWRRRRAPPRMIEPDQQSQDHRLRWGSARAVLFYALAAAFQLMIFGPIGASGVSSTAPLVSEASIVVVGVLLPMIVVAVQWVVVARSAKSDVFALRIMATAPAPSDDGAWGLRAGKVQVGEITRTSRYVVRGLGIHVQGTSGSTESRVGRRRFLSVKAGEDRIRVVIEGHVRWGTTAVVFSTASWIRAFIDIWRSVPAGVEAVATESIEDGDEVLLLGRMSQDGRLEAGGPDSLLVLGARRGPIRDELERALRAHRLGMLAHPILMMVAVGFALVTAWAS